MAATTSLSWLSVELGKILEAVGKAMQKEFPLVGPASLQIAHEMMTSSCERRYGDSKFSLKLSTDGVARLHDLRCELGDGSKLNLFEVLIRSFRIEADLLPKLDDGSVKVFERLQGENSHG